ncbi:MAG TPA: 30S ribosomal protein S24e [Thermofilaceae archaeon]|nr:MAG: 30S ribosomal protein S24e [Thermoprotei archaeon]HDD34320.1 30S ribosomal protein S24e [Thermofilaceae archaeon]
MKRFIVAEGFKVEVLEEWENKLVERRELIVRINHPAGGTPPRAEVRSEIAKMLGVDADLVYVRSIRTEYGMCESVARVHVYYDVGRALKVEPEHVIRKNRGERGE